MSIELLRSGEMSVEGRLPNSSNYTFLVKVTAGDNECLGVYKPLEGEGPLDDFPPGLHKREVAAYELAEALGWPKIPPTVLREDAPFGEGSVQLFVDADFQQHYFTLLEDESLHAQLIDMAAFDIVANNTDRKAGHCLLVENKIYGIDNGLCFHVDPKLRTVIWDFAGTTLPESRAEDLRRVAMDLPAALQTLLEAEECEVLQTRMKALADAPVLPAPVSQWQFPWPLL